MKLSDLSATQEDEALTTWLLVCHPGLWDTGRHTCLAVGAQQSDHLHASWCLPHNCLRTPPRPLSRVGSAGYLRQLCALQGAAAWLGSQTGSAFAQRGGTGFISQQREVARLRQGWGVWEK